MVTDAWNKVVEQGAPQVMEALKGVATSLTDWSNNVLGDLEKRVRKLKVELEICRRSGVCWDQVAMEEILHYQLEKVEEQIDVYWRQ